MINWWIKIQAGLWIYKRKQKSKETWKHASNQESDQEKKKENMLSTKKVRFKKKR